MVSETGKKPVGQLAIIVLIVLLLVGVIYFGLAKDGLVKSDYQAVFLTNGQVYFGKLLDSKSEFLTLTNVYYFQTEAEKEEMKADDLVLVKLGDELHGPTDKMEINQEHILFIEDLADDSKVLKAIDSHNEN